jgi:dienelactone hydrolase
MIDRLLLTLLFFCLAASLRGDEPLPGTKPLTQTGDLSALMLSGMEKFLLRETERAIENHKTLWKRDFSSRIAYVRSVEPNRARFRRMIGVVDERLPIRELEYVGGTSTPSEIARTDRFTVHAVRWPVLEGVDGEGLLLQPKAKPLARVVALPDADQTPEMLVGLVHGLPPEQQWARRPAENGCQVVIPVLIDRQDTWSGNPRIAMTNCTHREWVYRPAFDLGRHIIGYEVQKILSLVDWFGKEDAKSPIAVAGYGEGGLIAFYTAGCDTRIDATFVSGYFRSRESLWQEPIYRNVFGLLREFGDAEIAGLILPRSLILEHSNAPSVDGPPATRDGRKAYAAPGKLDSYSHAFFANEVKRIRDIFSKSSWDLRDRLILSEQSGDRPVKPCGARGIGTLLTSLNVKDTQVMAEPPKDSRKDFDPAERQRRQVRQLVEHTQMLLRRSDEARRDFWSKAQPTTAADWTQSCADYREYLAENVIGRWPQTRLPANPRTRKVLDRDSFTGYEVMLDVFPDVFLWGILLLPKDLKPGEKRPVVVCQHGLEGMPMDVIDTDPKSAAYASYKGFASRLAERGFIVFAPHHYYRGGNRFRQLQRIAYPLGKTLFAFVVAQHEQLLDWLDTLPNVDSSRIGFYGLSYGGFSAMRLPALVPRYALSINSAEFNDMAKKKCSVHDVYSYPFYNTYEVFEWNLANTFNYSDLATLIAPRPFMVERGHNDSVAPDEWVASEYAKVRRLYVRLGIGERTAIEYFNGPHTINGKGTFEFLHKHLRWPEKKR